MDNTVGLRFSPTAVISEPGKDLEGTLEGRKRARPAVRQALRGAEPASSYDLSHPLQPPRRSGPDPWGSPRNPVNPTLVFVYNADSGLFSVLSDAVHKLVSPATYACSLCALTYSHVGMRREWRNFIEELEIESEFLHADELAARYGVHTVPLPAVFRRGDTGLELLLNKSDLDACRTLAELEHRVSAALEGSGAKT